MNKKITNILITATALSLMAVGIVPLSAQNQNPVPTISYISPDSMSAGSSSITLTVNGGNFMGSSVVYFNGNPKSTTYLSSTQLTAIVTTSDLAVAGNYNVVVQNPTPGGGSSNSVTFRVTNSNNSPVITSISPSQVYAGGPSFTLVVSGSNFVAGNTPSVVRINGLDRVTSYVSSVQLTATIFASDITSPGTKSIRVYNAGPNNGGISNVAELSVNAVPAGAPVITSISPSTKVVGSGNFNLTVNGLNFNGNSQVRFNGLLRTTTYYSPTLVTALILASDLSTAGLHAVTVTNTDTGTSNAVLFDVAKVPGLPNTGIGPDPEDPNPSMPLELVIGLAALLTLPVLSIVLAKARVKNNV